MAYPHAIKLFPNNVLLEAGVVGLEEIGCEPLLNEEMADLRARAVQRFLQGLFVSDFEMRNLKIACYDRGCRSHERLVGRTVLEFVMGLNRIPNDNDAKLTRMCWHQSRVYCFDALCPLLSDLI